MSIQTLHLVAAAGTSLDSAVLLAAHAEEWREEARTLLLRFNAGQPRLLARYPGRLYSAWLSARTGRLYALDRGRLAVFQPDGLGGFEAPQVEIIPEVEDPGVFILGIADEAGDTLFVGDDAALHIRRGGEWRRFAAPEGAGPLLRGHGRRADQVFFCSEAGLLRWDGQVLSVIDSPPAEPWGVFESADGGLWITAEEAGVFHQRKGSAWRHHPTAFEPLGAVAGLGEAVYAEVYEQGLARINGQAPEIVYPADQAVTPWSVGDALILAQDAIGAEARGNAVFDGTEVHPFQMPACAPGSTALFFLEATAPARAPTPGRVCVTDQRALRGVAPALLTTTTGQRLYIFDWQALSAEQQALFIEGQVLAWARSQVDGSPGDPWVPWALINAEPLEPGEVTDFDAQADGALLVHRETGEIRLCPDPAASALVAVEHLKTLGAVEHLPWRFEVREIAQSS